MVLIMFFDYWAADLGSLKKIFISSFFLYLFYKKNIYFI